MIMNSNLADYIPLHSPATRPRGHPLSLLYISAYAYDVEGRLAGRAAGESGFRAKNQFVLLFGRAPMMETRWLHECFLNIQMWRFLQAAQLNNLSKQSHLKKSRHILVFLHCPIEINIIIRVQMLKVVCGAALLACSVLNALSSRFGHTNIRIGDKDILLPFSATMFLFYALLIYLPETHYKLTVYSEPTGATAQQTEQDEEQNFPMAFWLAMASITVAVLVHRLLCFEGMESEEEALQRRNDDEITTGRTPQPPPQSSPKSYTNVEYRVESQILKYYLSLAIGLQNIVSGYYVTIGNEPTTVQNELIIFGLSSLMINFAYGYINGWSAVSASLNDRLSVFINIGTMLGYLLGLTVENNLIVLTLPCFCCGLMIYSATLVCIPTLFSNGEDHSQDKYRYGAICTSLLVTVIYHPICYLLRV